MDGLFVSKLVLGPGEKAKWIRHPSTFTREKISKYQSETLTTVKLKQWKHLDIFSEEFCGNESITVDLIIRANSLKALEPLEVVPSQANGPYAIRAALG